MWKRMSRRASSGLCSRASGARSKRYTERRNSSWGGASAPSGTEPLPMMIGTPLVSIVTPILNGRKFLDECIQSVLGQRYPNIEHIFVDGGSSDGSREALAAYQ